MGNRDCLQCGVDINHKRPYAKFCSSKCQDKDRYYRNQDARREAVFKSNYGITFEERDAMYSEQEGKCLVCEAHMTWDRRKANSVHVDHCHTTGEVHGLLCHSCNTAAGLLGENVEIAASLVKYLAKTGKVAKR